jgi:eukaryotic-like serine/threonine-protein kinase
MATTTDYDDSRLGSMIAGRWRLEAVLGRGSAGSVFVARDARGGRVALKILNAEWAAAPQSVERFVREARIASMLRHPVAVPVLADGVTDDGEPFLVMELLRGNDLERHLSAAGIPVADAMIVADRILDLLDRAHRLGIVHRDLKPQNVFIEASGAIRVLDFGIARMCGPDEERLTQVGFVLGTPGYMAPEQARGDQRDDLRSDLWAVGAILFSLLSGRPVRYDDDPLIELTLAVTTPAPKLSSVAPRIDRGLAELVDRALGFEPHERFQSAQAMQRALSACYERLFGMPMPRRVRPRARPGRADRRRHERLPSAFAVGLHARRGPRVGVCRSYARSGLVIASPSRFAPGETIEVELPGSCTGSSPLLAPGRVVRVGRNPEGGVFSELTVIELAAPIPPFAHRRITDRLAAP